ncbi:hypothetical protein [Roseinatronobacter sp.]
MSTDKHLKTDADPLDAFFDAARDQAPDLSPDLRARILADAAGAMHKAASPAPSGLAVRHRVVDWLRGWAAPSLAGGITAAAAGFWFGVAAPLPVAALDAPLWLQDALFYFDVISTPLVGLDDPLLWGF